MATIQPKGEKVRQAIKWIADARLEGEDDPLSALIEKASCQFNLSPKEEAFIRSFYEDQAG